MGDRAGLGGLQGAPVAEDEDVGVLEAAHRVLVAGDEVHLVAEAGAGDVVRAHVERDRDEQVVRHAAVVVGDELLGVRVDALDGEVGLHVDVAVGEHAAELAGGDGLGEGAVQRGDVDDLDLLARPALPEPRVGQERELQRRDRALDRHVGDVDDEASAPEHAQGLAQGDAVLEVVEVVDVLRVLAGRLVGAGLDAGGDDERVVGELPAAAEVDDLRLGVHAVDLGQDEVDAGLEVGASRLGDVLAGVRPERQEQVPRLVVVLVVPVDDGDLQLGRAVRGAQLVGGHGSGGSAAQDDQFPHGGSSVRVMLHHAPGGIGMGRVVGSLLRGRDASSRGAERLTDGRCRRRFPAPALAPGIGSRSWHRAHRGGLPRA